MPALTGVRIVEFAGLGPSAFAATTLADMGAKVLRLDRATPADLGAPKGAVQFSLLRRSRYDVAMNLKAPANVVRIKELLQSADALIEGFRPGVMERLGLGPEDCLAINPSLVYARVTGWGQDGPLAARAGHDINYLARTGVLDALGRCGQPPTVPLTLIGDMGGAGTFAVAGILAALLEATRSKKGQVLDISAVDAISNLALSIFGRRASGEWKSLRGSNYLDSGAPFYDAYQCADGKYVAVGAIERRFFDSLLDLLQLTFPREQDHFDRKHWPNLRSALTSRFLQKSRDEWAALFALSDCCAEPVLSFDEAVDDQHLKARKTFTKVGGVHQPVAAVRFGRTPNTTPCTPKAADEAASASQIANWLA